MPISINISRQHVFDSVFRDCIVDFSKEFQVPPELVVLELTESGFLEDNETMYEHLQYLKGKGFSLSMDDFGRCLKTVRWTRLRLTEDLLWILKIPRVRAF